MSRSLRSPVMMVLMLTYVSVVLAQEPASWPKAEITETSVAKMPETALGWRVSEDGLHVAFIADFKKEKSAIAVHDVDMDDGFVSIDPQGFSLSKDGRHLAYWAKLRDGHRLIADHVVVTDAPKPGPGRPAWSHDGSRFGYSLLRDKKQVVVVDGKAGPEYDAVDGPLFSADGKHVAYLAKLGKAVRMVFDGVEGPAFQEITALSFGPKGGRFAYLASNGSRLFKVLDGIVDSSIAGLGETGLVWSPDGRHVACSVASSKDDWYVQIDDQRGPPYFAIGPPVFSADGEHLAFWGVKKDPARDPRVLIRDGQVAAEVHLLGKLSLSADGQRLAYVEALDEKQTRWVVVVDGQRSPECEGVSSAPAFSPDGRHVAYVMQQGGKQHLVIDGERIASSEKIFLPPSGSYFGSNGAHRTFLIAAAGKTRVLHDGAQGPEYDGVMPPGPSVQPDGSVSYLAIKDGVIFRVNQAAGAR